MENQVPEWANGLPDEIKSTVSNKGWKTPADIIGSYTNLEKTLGTKRLQMPAQDWKDEQWDAFYKEAGRPEKPDEYKLPEYKLPDGVSLEEGRISEAKAALHKLGLHPRQFEGAMKYYLEMVGKDATAAHEARRRDQEAAEFKLKDEWKADYDLNLKVGKDALAKFGGPELVEHLNQTGLGNHPAMIKMFHSIGKGMMEDTAKGKATQPGATGDPNVAKSKITALKADKEFMAKFFKGDKDAAAQWSELHKQAFPTETQT